MLHKTNEASANMVDDNNRWILDVTPHDRTTDVAACSIRQRLQVVDFYLPLAATKPDEDIEHVHQLRVASRRAVAAIKLYYKFLPGKSRKSICRRLKEIRRAAGNARDCDVLLQRHEQQAETEQSQTLLKEIYQKREEAQRPLCELYASLPDQHSLIMLSRKMLKKVRRQRAPHFRRWARRRLRDYTKAFFAAEPDDLDNLHALHQMRLRGKDLRYAIELLAGVFPNTLRLKLYPVIEQVQDGLGAINDHAVAIERFKRWRAETESKQERDHIRDLIRSEKELLTQTMWEFARWWTPKRSRHVQRRFHKLVDSR